MSVRPMFFLLPALMLTAVATAQSPDAARRAPPPPPPMTAAECEVWERERSFAQSVVDHDAAAFTAHLHAGAVFIDGGGALARGRDGITRAWTPMIEGKDIVLRWYPQRTVIGGDPDTAHSRGPFWIENPDPAATHPYVIGQFVSIWRKVDGQWQVLFDGGGGGTPTPATQAQVDALKASLPATCPRD